MVRPLYVFVSFAIIAGCNDQFMVRGEAESPASGAPYSIAGPSIHRSDPVAAPVSGTQPSAQPSAALAPAAVPTRGGSSTQVTFNDLQAFDRLLEKSLKSDSEKVVVVMEDRVPLKEMPQRVDKWLAAVDNNGGKVNVKSDTPEIRTRALPLLGIAISAYQFFKENAKDAHYEAARDYDATVVYKRDPNGDRVVDRIEMTRRPR